ncbi:MAG TPA: hypothetical protein VFC63_09145 [Blastocatellia bacterium]|nr:hypothetical protein [Blastocatellia bacterium]
MRSISEELWQDLGEEVTAGMKKWREQHPRATLSEIEGALDERLGKMRAEMLQDVAMVSESTNLESGKEKCPECGEKLESKGKRRRNLKTVGEQEISLERDYGECPKCKAGLFPPR